MEEEEEEMEEKEDDDEVFVRQACIQTNCPESLVSSSGWAMHAQIKSTGRRQQRDGRRGQYSDSRLP
eukprot:6511550-Pyramimonas_sp.AAC.1